MATVGPRFSVLGPVEVVREDGSTSAPPGRKPRQLMASLLLRRGRPVSTALLVDDLWGDDAPAGADTTLRSHVSAVRRWLGEHDAADLLTTGPSGYRFAPARDQVDADLFEDLVGRSQEALGLGQAERAETAAREALALWRGGPFGELPDVEQAVVEVARLDELRFAALEVRGAAQLQRGRHREAVAELDALVAAHPFRERFCEQLMVALYRSGRQADALASYGRLRESLADELGLDPGPEIQQLSQQILRQDPVLAGDPSVAVTDLASAPPAAALPDGASPGLPDALLDAAARSPMVGREAEWDRLSAAWATTAGGGRRVVLLSGEAGIGKTRLVAELAAEAARAGRPALVGRSEGTGRAYHAIADALQSTELVTATIADLPDGVRLPLQRIAAAAPTAGEGQGPQERAVQEQAAQEQAALYAAAVQLVHRLAASGPVLVLVEDAERIDRASALLLRHLAERLPAGVLLVLCFRDPPGARHEPLGDLLGTLSRNPLVDRIALGRLDVTATATLLGEVLGDIAALGPTTAQEVWERTGGNPYFATEVGRNLAGGTHDTAEVPSGIRDALRHRLRELAPVTQQVLVGAAVLTGQVEFGVLSRVLEAGEDEVAEGLDDAVRSGLLVESGRSWAGTYTFPHDLVRDAVREGLSGQQLRRMHARCAQVLAATTVPGGPGSSAVALHLRGAGASAPTADTVDWCLSAAREAESLAAWDEAIEHAEAAVELLQSAGGTRLAEVCVVVAGLRIRSTQGFDRAVELLDVALREYTAAGEDERAAVIHSRLGGALSLHHSVMDIPRALEHLDAADRLGTDPRHTFLLAFGRTQAAMFGLRTDLLQESADLVVAIAQQSGRRGAAALADWASGWAAFNRGDTAGAFAHLDRSWRAAHEVADPTLGWGTVNAAALMANGYLLDPALARTWCRRALGQPRFDTLEYGHQTAADQLALALCLQGDLSGAREAVAVLDQTATARRMLTFLEGDWEAAEASWAAAVAHDEAAGDRHDALTNLRWLATARTALGDTDGARTALDRALALAVSGPQVPSEVAVRAALARLLAAADPAAARQHVAAAERVVGDGTGWHGLAAEVALAAAVVAEAGGDTGSADRGLERALEVAEQHGLAWLAAAVRRTRAEALERRGDGAAADAHEDAAASYSRIGAHERWLAWSGLQRNFHTPTPS
ncbi:hypothetical protein DJ010_08895 [Nocardioides silvaticus]|uniref:OmpR/PhoB-type domain-containing protein n=1 Tax=Nocardioides silvaticus TaxID=2201891 RepID=A0A316TUX5_9ACTN|nr:BTAD domain-containing putative transcriptional regulator [Nocardioides silvaticus]PWN03226.1 hypothetical protein DJ010_08895 [Nocardioides silvaticus]